MCVSASLSLSISLTRSHTRRMMTMSLRWNLVGLRDPGYLSLSTLDILAVWWATLYFQVSIHLIPNSFFILSPSSLFGSSRMESILMRALGRRVRGITNERTLWENGRATGAEQFYLKTGMKNCTQSRFTIIILNQRNVSQVPPVSMAEQICLSFCSKEFIRKHYEYFFFTSIVPRERLSSILLGMILQEGTAIQSTKYTTPHLSSTFLTYIHILGDSILCTELLFRVSISIGGVVEEAMKAKREDRKFIFYGGEGGS